MHAATLLSLGGGALVVLLALTVGLLALLRSRRRVEEALVASLADVQSLRERVDDLSRQLGPEQPAPTPEKAREFVITSLSDPADGLAVPEEPAPTTPLSAGEFTSVAVGESLVRLLSLGYGVRRALSPESRDRIRLGIRQEVRRARRQRRRDLKEAKRHLRTHPTGQSTGQSTGLAEDAA